MTTSNAPVRDTVGMPRRFPQPLGGADEWVSERVKYERTSRGLSMGELARRMTEAGAPVKQQTIGQIENGTPPRKVSLGEAIALCEVFGIEDVAELGWPVDAVFRAELGRFKDKVALVHRAAGHFIEAEGELRQQAVSLIRAAVRADTKADSIDEVADIALTLIAGLTEGFRGEADRFAADVMEARRAAEGGTQ